MENETKEPKSVMLTEIKRKVGFSERIMMEILDFLGPKGALKI